MISFVNVFHLSTIVTAQYISIHFSRFDVPFMEILIPLYHELHCTKLPSLKFVIELYHLGISYQVKHLHVFHDDYMHVTVSHCLLGDFDILYNS